MKSLASVLFATVIFAAAACSNSDLEGRVKKLEDQNKKYSEAMAFLQKVYDQQQQQPTHARSLALAVSAQIDPDVRYGGSVAIKVSSGFGNAIG